MHPYIWSTDIILDQNVIQLILIDTNKWKKFTFICNQFFFLCPVFEIEKFFFINTFYQFAIYFCWYESKIWKQIPNLKQGLKQHYRQNIELIDEWFYLFFATCQFDNKNYLEDFLYFLGRWNGSTICQQIHLYPTCVPSTCGMRPRLPNKPFDAIFSIISGSLSIWWEKPALVINILIICLVRKLLLNLSFICTAHDITLKFFYKVIASKLIDFLSA